MTYSTLPLVKNGKATGYMSVQTKPSIAQVREAEQLYKDSKNGNLNNVKLRRCGEP
ncbi:hypothetical protein [Undibacterium sp. Di24W]|uniref:hypothetical protein n=1 Tax=Undibacterium sp. Di24W TaxID=3413033 RepID=UPI003BF5D9F2